MTTSKDVKKEHAMRRINTPDSMALYGNFGAGHAHQGTVEEDKDHYEPKGDIGGYEEANASTTDSTTQDLSESTTESETSPTSVAKKQGGFFYKLTTLTTYPLQAKSGKHE
jgi:hypothetical protein